MEALLKKDISQMSYEELEKAARHYGLNESSKVDLVQIDGLVRKFHALHTHIPPSSRHPHLFIFPPRGPSGIGNGAAEFTLLLHFRPIR